jgi:pimeloyl-ACP methyl ester carboxylesterase
MNGVFTITLHDEGTKMDFLRFGRENGGKLVILPGLSLKSVLGAAEAIKTAYAILAKSYDVYLFDHVRKEPDGYGIEDMAKDTLLAFDRLGLSRVSLMGVSMGGMAAQAIASAAPERVSSLILCSTAMNTDRSDPTVFENWRTLAERKDGPALMAAFGECVYSPSFYARYKDAVIASGSGVTDAEFRNFLISLRAIRRFDARNDVKRITCPVYVIGAGEDRVLGVQAARDLIEALHCESYIYEGYGHGVYDEAQDYLSRIDSFLNRH